jgi:hypothetical protein
MPWQQAAGAESQVSPEEEPSGGHFPVVIFVWKLNQTDSLLTILSTAKVSHSNFVLR